MEKTTYTIIYVTSKTCTVAEYREYVTPTTYKNNNIHFIIFHQSSEKTTLQS